MDQEPSTSQGRLSPRRKRPPAPFSATEKLMIRNLFKYIWEEKAAECLKMHDYKMRIHNECTIKVADMIGISPRTVYKILKEHKENKEFSNPRKTGPKRNFKDKLSESDFEGIRRIVQQFKDKIESPTIDKVHRAMLDDPTLPNFSRSTMLRVMQHLRGAEKKNGNPSNNSNNNDNSEEIGVGEVNITEIILVEVDCEFDSDEDSS